MVVSGIPAIDMSGQCTDGLSMTVQGAPGLCVYCRCMAEQGMPWRGMTGQGMSELYVGELGMAGLGT